MPAHQLDSDQIYKQGFVQNALIMLMINGASGNIIDANARALDFYGYDLDDLKTATFNDLCVDPDLSRNPELQRGLSGDLPIFTATQRIANGQLKFVEVYSTPIALKDHKQVLLFAIIDGTRRQQTEQILRQTELRYRTIADFNHDWEYWETPDGLFDYVSPSCERITGYSVDDFSKNPLLLHDIVYSEDKPVWEQYREHLTGNSNEPRQSVQFRIVHRNDDIRWIEHVSQIVIDENDVFLGYRASNRDITDRKAIEQELKHSKEWLELAVNSTNMAMWEWNIQTQRFVYDHYWAEMLGYTYDEIQPMDTIWDKLVHPQDKPKSTEYMNALLDGKANHFEVEQRIQSREGQWRWFLTRGNVVEHDGNGKPLRIVGVDVDITSRKRAESDYISFELEKQRTHLLANFIQDAKHEFKTPLSRINTKLYLMQRATDPQKRDEIASAIEEQVSQIDHLVDSLMLMARLDTTDSTAHDPVNIRLILTSLITDVGSRLYENNLSLRSEIPDNIPIIRGDMNDLYEAFARIFDNAIRYTPHRGRINVHVRVVSSHIVIEINDTGSGISKEALPRIFDRFFREDLAHTTSGIGLGLSIAKKIIEQHGGGIHISSRIDFGTTVQVRLPTISH